MPRLSRLAALACLLLLAVLAWLPADKMVRTGVDGRIEHFIAYLGTAIIVLAAYIQQLGVWRLGAMLVCYAGVLELGQYFSPGRHLSVFDFAASSFGVIAGSALFRLADQLQRSRSPDE
jgi:VanZ family protein